MGLVTKRRTDQVVATGPMPWIESNWAYDTLGRVTSQTVQKGANVGGAAQGVAQQTLAYFGNDDPSSLFHVMRDGISVSKKDYTFGYDWRHQLISTVAVQSALAVAPYMQDGEAFRGTYGYGSAGRLNNADVGVGLGALPGSEVKVRKVDYCYQTSDKEQVSALRLNTAGTIKQCDPGIRDPHDAVLPGELAPNQTSASPTYASYRYDDAGNQTERYYPAGSPGASGALSETDFYVYDGENRLRRVTKKIGAVVTGSEEYWYDEKGARVGVLKRDAGGVKQELRWFIGDTQAHYDAAGAVTKVYSHLSLGTPIARVERTGNANSATAVEYQFHGLASNTLAAVASDGVVNANMAYAPYGELIEAQQASAAVGVPVHQRRMNDKYVDELGGLAYYGARYYDKVLIGWTQADPLYRFTPDAAWKDPRRRNLYTFTAANPIRYQDPDGRDVATDAADMYPETAGPNDLADLHAEILLSLFESGKGHLKSGEKTEAAKRALIDALRPLLVASVYLRQQFESLMNNAKHVFTLQLTQNGSELRPIYQQNDDPYKPGVGAGGNIYFNPSYNSQLGFGRNTAGQTVSMGGDAAADLSHELSHADAVDRGVAISPFDALGWREEGMATGFLPGRQFSENGYRASMGLPVRICYECFAMKIFRAAGLEPAAGTVMPATFNGGGR